eukprot:SAG31_NODE_362_length_16904_cov_7.893218_12_plen_50_part_00
MVRVFNVCCKSIFLNTRVSRQIYITRHVLEAFSFLPDCEDFLSDPFAFF